MSARASPRQRGKSNGLPQAKEKESHKGRERGKRERWKYRGGGNAFIYIYGIVDDAARAYVRFEMHKERARGRGINFQWGDKNGRDGRVNIRRTQLGM